MWRTFKPVMVGKVFIVTLRACFTSLLSSLWKCFLFYSWAYGFWILIYVCIKRCVHLCTCILRFTSYWIYPCRQAVLEQSWHVRLSFRHTPYEWSLQWFHHHGHVIYNNRSKIRSSRESRVLNRLDKVTLNQGYFQQQPVWILIDLIMRGTTPRNVNLMQISEYLRLWIWTDLRIHSSRFLHLLYVFDRHRYPKFYQYMFFFFFYRCSSCGFGVHNLPHFQTSCFSARRDAIFLPHRKWLLSGRVFPTSSNFPSCWNTEWILGRKARIKALINPGKMHHYFLKGFLYSAGFLLVFIWVNLVIL